MTKEQFQLCSVCTLFLMIALSSPWFDTYVSNHAFVKSYFSVLGFGVLFLLTFWRNNNPQRYRWEFNHLKLTLLLVFALGTLSSLWTINIDFTITKWLLWLGALFSFYVAYNTTITIENLTKLAWGLTIAACSIAIIGILQHLFDPFELLQAAPPGSTFGNKNMADQPLVLILPLSLYLMFSESTQNVKTWLLATMISSIIVFVFYTTTRAAWLSIAVELAIIIGFFIIKRKSLGEWIDWNKNKRNASLFALAIILILINLSADGFTSFLSTASATVGEVKESAENVNSPRYHIWGVTSVMILDAPFFGTGLGSFAHNLSNEGYATAFTKGYQRAHNDILELAVELGLAGLLAFCGLIVSLLISLRIIYTKSDKPVGLFYFLIFASLVGSFVNMQFSFPYQMAVPLVLLGFFLGLIAKKYGTLSPIGGTAIIPIKQHLRAIIITFWIAVFALITLLYSSWINLYSQLNTANKTVNFSDTSFVETPIYHQGLQTMLSRLGGTYFNRGNYAVSNTLDDQLLSYWPNYLNALSRNGYGAFQQGDSEKALGYTSQLKKVQPEGLFTAETIEMLVYQATNQNDDFLNTFRWLLEQPESELATSPNTYHFMLFLSLGASELKHFGPDIYQKYLKHHGYSCEVENNIAVYYFNEEQFSKAAEHTNLAINDKSKCINQQMVQLLKDKGYLN